MGVVYRAEDTTLRRPVALKFLTEESLGREDRRVRFLREARLAAALSHPNICTVYEVGEIPPGEERKLPSGGLLRAHTPWIAMEHIEGRSLQEEIRAGKGLPLEKLLRIAVHVAEGLAAAHARKIVHRDLKPGNVMLDSEGRARILDFGLAKPLTSAEQGDGVLSEAETISEELTREGLVVGTSAYMSPEQARGDPLDARSDVFSFGIMLYEMVTGRRPFQGETASATRLKIAEAEAEPLPEDRDDVPEELERIIRRCLKKSPGDRFNDTRDLAASLRDLRQETSSGRQRRVGRGTGAEAAVSGAAKRRTDRERSIRWALAAAGAIALALIGAWMITNLPRRAAPPPPSLHRQITFTGSTLLPEISPDGQYVAYLLLNGEDARVLVKDLSGGDPLEVFRMRAIRRFRWSPDGTTLAVLAREDTNSEGLFLVPRLGGTPRKIRENAAFFAWSPDGSRIATGHTASRAVEITDVRTGAVTSVALDDAIPGVFGLDWSPGEEFLAVRSANEGGEVAIWAVSLDGGRQVKLLEPDPPAISMRWSPDGSALYYLATDLRTSELRRIGFDPDRIEAGPEEQPVLTGLTSGRSFSLSRDGTRLVYAKVSARRNLYGLRLGDGSEGDPASVSPLTSGTFGDEDPSVSPDGRQIAFVREGNIYTMPSEGGPATQRTFVEEYLTSPAWSPDGTRLAFGSVLGGPPRVWMLDIADGGAPRLFEETKLSAGPPDVRWAPGSKIL